MATQIIPLGRNRNLVDVPDKAAARANLGVTAAIDAAANAASAALTAGLATKQNTLVSGTSIRTINGSSLLGSGDIAISASVAPLVLGTNLVEQRNGTAGQIARWFKTFTSATNFEAVEIDAATNATTFDLAACIGSAGGVARGIRIGGKNAAGTFTPWLSFATNGNGLVNSSFLEGNGWWSLEFSRGLKLHSAVGIKWTTTLTNTQSNTFSLGIDRVADGLLEINNGTAGTLRDLLLRDLIAVPSASRTLATNGRLTFERVSNTVLNLVYRGDDGTTRRSSLTFS